MGVRADYAVDLGERATLTYGVRVFRDDFISESYNRTNARLSVRWKRQFDVNMVQITGYLQETMFGGSTDNAETDFTELDLNLNYHRELSDSATAIATFRARQRDYEGETSSREPDLSLSLGLRQVFSNVGVVNYGLAFVSRDNPKNDHSRYDSTSLYSSLDSAITETTSIGLTGEFGVRTFNAPNHSTSVVRSDDFMEIGISVRDTRLDVLSATPELRCGYNRTLSNIDEYDSGGRYCGVMFERRF